MKDSNGKERKNRLADEGSPYLLQHADNPVEWYPWGDEAFALARREDRPVFLSIGYATCHWCHVMAHESFENGEVARLLNEGFVPVKVDREERPDIDRVYMTACQMMTGSGGWPLSIIMTPDGRPFFAATYIPRHGHGGMAGMLELLPRVTALWKERRGDIDRSADEIAGILKKEAPEGGAGSIGEDAFLRAYDYFSAAFDDRHAGFGTAPKFPSPHNLLFLFSHWRHSGDESALEMALATLRAMRRGGIYDHLGSGFHRYATDREWILPHFEKMLYDQATAVMAYTEAFQITGDPFFAETAREVIGYLLRDMSDPGGAFYSAEDADSGGREGAFYLWTLEEVRGVLGPEDAVLASDVFNIRGEGNFRDESTGRMTGENILHLAKGDPDDERIAGIKSRLFLDREKRDRPQRDEKILADWNGLAIAALARAGLALGEEAFIAAAGRAADFILAEMTGEKGRLFHRYVKGSASISGYLDDYAFFTWGLIELYQAARDEAYLERAREFTGSMLRHFRDPDSGAFYFTPDDGERLITRPVDFYDGAMPSGNSVALHNLAWLSRLTGDTSLKEAAVALIGGAAGAVIGLPQGHSFFLTAVRLYRGSLFDP